VEDAQEMPRGLGGDAVYLFGEAADIVRVSPPPERTVRHATLKTSGVPVSSHSTDSAVRSQSAVAPIPVEAMLAQVRDATRSRPTPDAVMIGRLFRHACDASLVEALVITLEDGVARPGLSRRFRNAGLPSPRTWLAAIRAIRAVAYAQNRCTNQETAARTEGHTGVTLSTACRQSFGLAWKALGTLLTWEGLVELFLRKQGATLATTGTDNRWTMAG
jgi:hypothetical protein